MYLLAWLGMGLQWGCRGKEATTIEEEVQSDLDGDGFSEDVDCNDGDIQVHPDAMEICDGIDNNCDGNIDEDVKQVFYADSDGDGFGNADITVEACSAPNGFVDTGTDCNDSSAVSYPAAVELCDALDNDCDEDIDEDLDLNFFLDSDGDGFGDDNNIISGCAPELGLSTIGGDCNDQNPAISPVANELCNEIDDNCDGDTDEGVQSTFYNDQDQDGFGDAQTTALACSVPEGYVNNADDCNDIDSQIQPNADELCDDQDNDCDGVVDEEGAIGGLIWYGDADGDGYGKASNTIIYCTQPTGYVSNPDDCDDSNSIFSPAATEVCNGYDDNCDGTIDEDGAFNAPIWYQDGDADGFGNGAQTLASCSQPSGYLADSTDCDDNDNDIHPSATELCNGEDDNCDGNIDEASASDAQMWYADTDTDGYGDASTTQLSCTQPSGYVSNADDCDDTSLNISPERIWYIDSDADGFGSSLYTTNSCTQPSGYVASATDCDDTESATYPAAAEICDGSDNDCDGSTDEDAIDASTWYVDTDTDGYGDANTTQLSCTQPSGYVSNTDDCDDTSISVSPDTIWYADADGDGFGSSLYTTNSCTQPSGYVSNATDCDDTEENAYPSAAEVCDGIDNDCDGGIDTNVTDATLWYADTDSDGFGDVETSQEACFQPTGYVSNSDDCDDGDALSSPSVIEVCDGIDNDCDEDIDEGDVVGTEAQCFADSCASILAANPEATDGVYYITSKTGSALQAYCDMDFAGGGWLAVFNYMHSSSASAADFHSRIIQNSAMAAPVYPDDTSSAIMTSSIDLSDYHEIVYGWAPSEDDDVNRYGHYNTSGTLVGACYVDGYCGANVSIGSINIQPTGNTRTIYTGNSPSYPHVGLGFDGQIIVWGYDNNGSSYSNWANWYDGNPCCNAGNTSDITSAGWRYTVYVR